MTFTSTDLHFFGCIGPLVYTQLNDKSVLFQTIQFSMNYFFALNLNVKQFYLTH